MKFPRRHFLRLAAATLAAGAVPGTASGQSYPTRPVTLVVPIAAGGAIDTAARIFAEKLQDQLQKPFVVENRPGAGALIGTDFAARAAADGYTLLLMEISSVLVKWLNRNVPFDVTRDFAPIAMVATTPLVLFAHPSVPANDVKELIAYCKSRPGKFSVGTAGAGTPHHLAALMLNAATGIEITHVPYRGSAPALNDLLGGQIPLIWATPIAAMPFVEQGRIRALGVSSQTRMQTLPEVPTVAENAVPGFALDVWLGIAAPAHVQPQIIGRVGDAVLKITQLPDVQRRMLALGYEIDFRSTDQFRELIVSDYHKYGTLIHQAGIEPN
jgi:tripartite-type tricarboxylate transporter receptor subunit TctC